MSLSCGTTRPVAWGESAPKWQKRNRSPMEKELAAAFRSCMEYLTSVKHRSNMKSQNIRILSWGIDSCIELAVARHMCGMLNQNVHRTFWLKHNPGVSPGQILKKLLSCIFFRPFFEHVGFVGQRVGDDLQCSDQGSGRSQSTSVRDRDLRERKCQLNFKPKMTCKTPSKTVHAGDPWRDNDTG